MTGRLDMLAESDVTQRVLALQTAVTDLKTSQVAGSANVITERYASGANFDFAATVKYQVTTAYEVTISTRDTTFSGNPFVWQLFWNVVNSPPSPNGFLQFTYAVVPANGQQKYQLYLWGTDAPNDPETLDIRVVIYGINVGSFSVAQII